MVGIYQDNFINFLRDHLGDPIKIRSKNIICKCPWCEIDTKKKHYHLSISIESPVFHCFYAGCHKSGTVSTLIKKILGRDESTNFIDFSKIKDTSNTNLNLNTKKESVEIHLPELDEKRFNQKALYLKSRLKFSNVDLKSIKGLIFDINEFFKVNDKLLHDNEANQLKSLFQEKFVGFLTENKSLVVLRNIDSKSRFRYSKIKIFDTKFFDYYKLCGNNPNSNIIVLGEGIFDIFVEHTFDILTTKNLTRMYATALSSSYDSLIKSIVYHEQLFRTDVVIISDRDIRLDYYRKLKKYNSHIIRRLTVYYNKCGKDFGETPVIPEKFII